MKTSLNIYAARQYSSVWILILTNLIPVYGVLFEDWKAFDVIIIYVLETIVIGLLNIFKMAFSTTMQLGGTAAQTKSSAVVHWVKLFIIPFFICHYFFFIIIQSIFVFAFINHQNVTNLLDIPVALWQKFVANKEIQTSVWSILGSHVFSFLANYIGNKEYSKVGLSILMVQPYIRIFIQQLVVIIGALLMSIFDTPNTFVILLVFLKIIADAFIHLKVHRKYMNE